LISIYLPGASSYLCYWMMTSVWLCPVAQCTMVQKMQRAMKDLYAM
jgi:hypothetical protein